MRKAIRFVIYFVLISISLIGIYIFINSLNRGNDQIVQASEGYFKNINPKFGIDFVNGQYVRFETVSSYKNPFEESKESIWKKIVYKLGIKERKKGIEISLIDVSYDTNLQGVLNEKDVEISSKKELNRGFELVSIGREIGGQEEGISKDTVISKNIYQGVDIEYQVVEGKGLKEEIVLNELPEYTKECEQEECSVPVNRFLFKIQLDDGLSLRRSIGSNSEYPTGTYYIIDSESNYLAHFLPEFAVDALGYKTSNVVSNISQTDSREYLYEIILDPEWLLSKERVFPIRIDPSIIHDSELTFDQGSYDRTGFNQNLTVGINMDKQKSGTYTSSIVELNENSTLRNISWQGYGESTGSGETPFSELDLIFRNDFNDILADKVKWGDGALYLGDNINKVLNINSNQSQYISLEFWSYRRHLANEQSIFTSQLGSLGVKDSRYVFKDTEGNEYISEIPVRFNNWQYITIVFNVSSNQASIYIDEFEYNIEDIIFKQSILDTLTFIGNGYIDSVRVYERILARNEISSNSGYGDIYLQLAKSTDGSTWGEWDSSKKYLPIPIQGNGYTDISLEDDYLSSYELISFDFLLEQEGNIVLGDSKFGNGVNDESLVYLTDLEGLIDTPEAIKYIDLQFIPTSVNNSCLLSLGGLDIYTNDKGRVVLTNPSMQLETDDMYELGIKNHIAVSIKGDVSEIFFNGNIYQTENILSFVSGTYSIGSGCSSTPNMFDGDIENVRVSKESKNSEEIVKYAHIEDRSYSLKPTFIASLQNDQQILDIDDTQFSISEMDFGAVNHIVNLNIGDNIVIKEGEFVVEGVVSYLDQDTGAVEVNNWFEGGSVPVQGFSKSAKVLKWQSEYIPVKDILDSNVLQKYLNISHKGIDIRGISIFSGVELNGTSYLLEGEKYLKYRVIFTTSKYGLSPYISSITVDYEEGGPSMEQIMRHGQWFNDGEKQGFWWSN